jgi:hypothetical protein
MPGMSDWYVVSFPVAFDFFQHGAGAPRILFGQNDGGAFRFDVTGTCGGSSLSCQSEGGPSNGLTDWQYFDNCTNPSCQSRSSGWPTQVFIRVGRITGGTDCSAYRIQVSR